MRLVSRWQHFYGKNFVLSSLPNCPECVAREIKVLKKGYEVEAEKANEEDRDFLMPMIEKLGRISNFQ